VLKGHQGLIRSVAVSPDSKSVLTGSFDGTARLWSAATGEPIGEPLTHAARVRVVAFSPDGNLAATGSFDGAARLWDAATGKPIGPGLGHRNWVVSVAFRADSKAILTGSADGTARLLEIPPAWEEDPDQITLRVQHGTGLELDDHGVIRVLDGPTWHQRTRE
jgi:WD40 repeat protein